MNDRLIAQRRPALRLPEGLLGRARPAGRARQPHRGHVRADRLLHLEHDLAADRLQPEADQATAGPCSRATGAATTGRWPPGSTPTRSARASRRSSWAPTTSRPGQFGDLTLSRSNENLGFDPNYESPYTDQFILSLERELGPGLGAQLNYVNKRGRKYAAWNDITGVYARVPYVDDTPRGATGRTLQLYQLQSDPEERQFRITNPDGFNSRRQRRELRAHQAHDGQVADDRLRDVAARHGLAPGRPGRRGRGGLGGGNHPARRAAVPPVRPEPQQLRERRRTPEERRRPGSSRSRRATSCRSGSSSPRTCPRATAPTW